MRVFTINKGDLPMETRLRKIGTVGTTAQMRVIPGHFATNHAHINYYLDLTMLKSRTSEAKAVAKIQLWIPLYVWKVWK